jgi:hypothetical protein
MFPCGRFLRFLAAFWLTTAVWLAASSAHAASPELLRYRGQEGQTYAYDVTITGETDDYVEELKGVISFKFDEVTGEQLKVTYHGGLKSSRKSKPREGGGGVGPRGLAPFGPGAFPRPPMSPFATTRFTGTTTTTNELIVTPRGEVKSMKGDSQLPYLLGNLSLMTFEPLSEEPQDSWTVNLGIAITDGGGPSGHPLFGRFGPFSGNRPEERTAGSEVVTYSTERVDGALVVFDKTYRLRSSVGDESYEINGTGKWTFNRHLGVSESLDFQQKLEVREGNTTRVYPVTIRYRRLSADEWNKIEQERVAAAKKLREEVERKAAAQKAAAEAPIEGDERVEVLETLRSDDVARIEAALKTLGDKTERSDEEIARAIEPLLEHAHSSVRENAEKALAKFSPEYKIKYDLNREYNEGRSVKQLGPPVLDDTPLPAGLIVAARRHGQWHAAKVVQLLDDGRVEVQFQKWPWKNTCPRADVRLAPPEVDQPDVDPTLLPGTPRAAAPSPGYRIWSDDTGTFTIEAKYLGDEGESVRLLRKSDGKEVKVPLARLSEADRTFVDEQRRAPKPTNPFEP